MGNPTHLLKSPKSRFPHPYSAPQSPSLLGQWTRTTKVIKLRADTGKEERQSLDSRRNNPIKSRRLHLRRKLVKQTKSLGSLNTKFQFAILDLSPIETRKTSIGSIRSKRTWVEQIHFHNLSCHKSVSIRLHTINPILREPFADEKRVHSFLVGDVIWSRRHQFV